MALSLETLLPTPYGWTSVLELAEGDLLFDEAGYPCRVTGVSEPVEAECRELRVVMSRDKGANSQGVLMVSRDQRITGWDRHGLRASMRPVR